MGKRGGSHHWKRAAVPKAVVLSTKKEKTWLVRPHPGPHTGMECVPLAVLLRDMLGYAKDLREVRRILAARLIKVDGTVRTEEKFPVGFMDVIDISKAGKVYRILVDSHGRLVPKEVTAAEKESKIGRIVKKYVIPGNTIAIRLHDGRVLKGDANLRVGDSVRITLPKSSVQKIIRLEPGAQCLVREGKHAGTFARLEEIIARKEGRGPEARLKSGDHEFITVARYLFAVDEEAIKGWGSGG